ncbi:MAG TPA: hypothetical protein ENI69_04365 [Rhodospirillales bacterium]|nr:hypothetical protein [Rhodospirillales bacterium]
MARSKVRKLFSAERRLIEMRGQEIPGNSAGSGGNGDVVSVDQSQVLAAIRGLRKVIEEKVTPKMPDDLPEVSTLKEQLRDLRDHIEETKKEIASIRHPDETENRLTSAAIELGAIVDATEQATHRILNATEEIDELVDKLKERSSDVGANEMLDELSTKTIDILEACNFQDISGQRTTKVVKIINFLEQRILSMIDIWGADEFAEVEIERDALDGDAALLQGPQHEGQGIDQNDIDALFD